MDIGLVLLGTLIALLIGLAVKFGFEKWGDPSQYDITWPEYGIAAVVILCLVAPLVAYVGQKVAISNQVTFHENLNGFEYRVSTVKYSCYESDVQGGSTGGCVRTYDADSYTVTVQDPPLCTPIYDSKGNKTGETCIPQSHQETRWRQVPYTDTEISWVVETTLGNFTVGPHWFPDNPQVHRIRPEYDRTKGLPDDWANYTGTPQFWSDARDRISRADPGPVAVRHDYANYILASQSTILKQYNSDIAEYEKAKLLPKLSRDPIHSFYRDDQTYFIGVNPPAGNWQFELQQLNAALGSTLQGNLYLVVVDGNRITNPDNYIGALTAYWESHAFDKDALSKNGIIVVVGTKDGTTVDWARASTGMPVGNNAMLLDLQNQLKGVALTPEALIGHPKALVGTTGNKFTVNINHSNGAIEKVLWGPHPFERVCMQCVSSADKAKGNQVGYEYLKSQIRPTGSQRAWILFFEGLASLLVWGACLAIGVPAARAFRGQYRSRINR